MSKAVPRLYQGFQPAHYNLTLDLDIAANKAAGEVTIRGNKTGRPSQRLTFHGKGLKVTGATVARFDKKTKQTVPVSISRINAHKTANEIRLHSDEMLYPGEYTVTIQFTAPIQETMHGIYRSEYKLEGEPNVLVSTQFESHHAREAFPCIDEPEAKATFDLTLITPQDLTVLSNMPVQNQEPVSGDGGETEAHSKLLATTFETTPKMSTYLLAFVAGELQKATTHTKDGVEVNVWGTYEHRPEAFDFALDTGKRCIEFFNDYYGTTYPLPKCDMIAIPSFSAGAMENWGLITYRDYCLLADPATASQSSRETVALVVCHELSHQWFGNLVTMRWWEDLWLNESFANVMEYVAVDALFPEWHVFNSFVANEGLSAFRRDSIPGVQSIKTKVNHPDEINSLFDPSIVYAKGGRLLNMLRVYVGDDDFRAGLKQYFRKHQYGNTSGSDLWAAIGAASGKDVTAFMNPWLEKSGFPLVTVTQTKADADTLELSQSHFLINPDKTDTDRRWPVPLFANAAGVPDLLSATSTTVTLETNSNPDYIRINQGAIGHYIVRYTEPAHMTAFAQLAADQTLTEVERLMLLSDSSMLARSGVSSLAETLRLLDYYTNEASEPVWDMITLVIADARRFEDSEPLLEGQIKAKIRVLIERQYQRLGWDEQPGEPSQDTKLRATILALGSYAEHPEIKAKALALFEAYKQDTNTTAVPSELRGIIFTSAVRYAHDNQAAPGAFDYLLKLEETTTDPNIKHELLSALSATRSTEDGARLLGRLKDGSKVRQHDVDYWLVMLMRNRYNQEQAWQWLRDNWEWIEQTFAGDKTYDSFPRYAASSFNTRQRLEEYRAFFEPKASETALMLNITLGVEELDNRVTWIERDLEAVKAYFAA